ncbi:interleukin-24 isoform X4 [Myotis lucifugus]|uniref:interleukin-24 isoform X4 n=1 Tax=Myotis lucifugus TaxID=59463 RepID=UPI000CCC2D70|nr:interleukin-24 isoform X4 [Myotis lucifugus]
MEFAKEPRAMLKLRLAWRRILGAGLGSHYPAHMLAVVPVTGLLPSSCPAVGWKTEFLQAGEAEPRSVISGCTGPGPEGRPQRPVSLPPSSILPVLPLLQMGSPMQKTALPCLSLILLIWSQGPGAQGQEFQFGPCRVEGVVFQELWEASRAVKDIVQAQDNIMSVQLLRREVLQNVSENEMFPIRESARRRFLLFQAAFKQLDIEAAQTKAFGEVDILLTWMQKFYQL